MVVTMAVRFLFVVFTHFVSSARDLWRQVDTLNVQLLTLQLECVCELIGQWANKRIDTRRCFLQIEKTWKIFESVSNFLARICWQVSNPLQFTKYVAYLWKARRRRHYRRCARSSFGTNLNKSAWAQSLHRYHLSVLSDLSVRARAWLLIYP